MKRNFFRACMLVGALGAFVACSDNSSVAPRDGLAPGGKPSFLADVPFNNDGQCMYNDALRAPDGTIDGVTHDANASDLNAAGALNCTANDISVANAQILQYAIADENGNFGSLQNYNGGT